MVDAAVLRSAEDSPARLGQSKWRSAALRPSVDAGWSPNPTKVQEHWVSDTKMSKPPDVWHHQAVSKASVGSQSPQPQLKTVLSTVHVGGPAWTRTP